MVSPNSINDFRTQSAVAGGAGSVILLLSALGSTAYVAGAAIAVLVAILASLAPARRAASVQPMVATRSV